MNRTRIKICGLTRPEDARDAAHLGADAVGLVFYRRSPRNVTPAQAAGIVAALPPFVTSVGLFVDPEPEWVEAVIAQVPLGLLQFHGDEPAGFCRAFGRPWMKAIRMRSGVDLPQMAETYSGACGLLVDAFDPNAHGGTGVSFDWSLLPAGLPLPLVVAGGLDANNAGEAIRRVRPWAVDVSSGVESAKGIKDAARMAAFVAAVRAADACEP